MLHTEPGVADALIDAFKKVVKDVRSRPNEMTSSVSRNLANSVDFLLLPLRSSISIHVFLFVNYIQARMYGTSQEIPIRDVVGESLLVYVDKYFSTTTPAVKQS